MSRKRKDNKGRILRDNEYQRSDGKYEYRYLCAGKWKSVYSWKLVDNDRVPSGKKDGLSLRDREKLIERDLDNGIDVTRAATMTLNELLLLYIDSKAKIKDRTRRKYIQLWELHIKESSFGKLVISKLKKVHVQKFYASLSEQHADATVRMYHNNLIMPALTFAVDNDLLRKNPAKGCLEGYNKQEVRETLTIQEQQVLLDYVQENPSYIIYYPMIQVMLGTACRIGEICGLTWSDIDMKNKLITIDHQLAYEKVKDRAEYYIMPPKTESGIRTIPMTKQVHKALLDQKKLDLILGRTGDYEVDGYRSFVFLNGNGKPFNTSLTNAIFKRIRERYNEEELALAKKEKRKPLLLPHISNHILRHTGCTRMAEAGMDAKVLQTLMGHSDINVTMRVYNHVDTARMKKEIEKIDEAM